MTPEKALQIVTMLANGIDPDSGEVLLETSPFNQVETVRALFLAAKVLASGMDGGKPARASPLQPNNAGAPWTPEEDAFLAERHAAALSEVDMAKQHGRTKNAISSRLIKLKLKEK